ncbi:PmoA family protein [Amycolatopsis acidiphila]|nr:DUF6807 family protein [Amycolatopsis acidiphila]UIJ62391.1 PmoA family protein [Amycolatopsis acidiphila]
MSGLALHHDEDAAVSVAWRGTELFRYVHVPGEPALESPKPFLHPMRSLAGDVVSLYRPHDHIWHKGLYLGVANYGEHNVWGGHTWVPGEGYRTWDDHGRIRHESFDRLQLSGGVVRIVERLCWEGADSPDFPPAQEVRSLSVHVDGDAWVLDFAGELTNVADRPVVLGSPTTKGRPQAGYGGLFWRGQPRVGAQIREDQRAAAVALVVPAAHRHPPPVRAHQLVAADATGHHDLGAAGERARIAPLVRAREPVRVPGLGAVLRHRVHVRAGGHPPAALPGGRRERPARPRHVRRTGWESAFRNRRGEGTAVTAGLELGRVAGPGGEEPAEPGLSLVHEQNKALTARWRGAELFRYVYQPWEPQLEAPKPYFHPLRTLGGDLVSLYRPHDHVWHKGISWSLCNVGAENFWGGPTYLRGEGYRQLDNDGTQKHVGFSRLDARPEQIDVAQDLEWVTQAGKLMFTEVRRFSVRAHPDLGAWQLCYASQMRNTSGETVSFGSPTTKGREAAGYSGLFWRGPRSFSGGVVVTPEGTGGDELMGCTAPWLGFVGRHDGAGVGSTVVFTDHPSNYCHPTKWFVRAGMYAVVCPAPFYDTEHDVAAGDTLTLRYDVLIADDVRDVEGCGLLAERASATDLFGS